MPRIGGCKEWPAGPDSRIDTSKLAASVCRDPMHSSRARSRVRCRPIQTVCGPGGSPRFGRSTSCQLRHESDHHQPGWLLGHRLLLGDRPDRLPFGGLEDNFAIQIAELCPDGKPSGSAMQ